MPVFRRFALASALTIVACSPAHAPGVAPVSQDGRLAAAKLATGKIRSEDILKDVSYLASDANMGRRTPFPNAPSPGYDSAATYIARFLKEIGVKPMGDSGTYFLHYTVTQSKLDTTKVSGAIGTEPLKWGDDFYVSGFLVGGVRQADVIYVGNGLARRKKGIDPYAGFDIKGKWILVNPITIRGQVRAGGVLGAPDTMGTIGIDYTTYMEEARFKGALGILLTPAPSFLNAWNRRATTGQDLNPSVGVAYAQYQVPRVVLSVAAVQRLLAGTTVSAAAVLAADSTKQYPKSAALGKRVTINFAATTAEAHPYNVVGLWEGSDPKLKDEWISLAAHLDGSVRAGGEVPGNTFGYHAADDNASGSAGNMAVARAIVAGPRPKRSILMVWDSGEEVGLWGTRTVAYGPLGKKLVLHVSNDMIGRSRAPNSPRIQNLSSSDSIYITGPKLLSSNTEANLQKALKEFPYINADRIYEDVTSEFYYPRTDAGPYLENGIPIMQFFNGTTPEYHQPSDQLHLLDIHKIEVVSKLSYGALWLAADDPVKPKWDGILPYTLWWVTPRNR